MTAIHRTVCNRDCPDACSILVTVEDGRATRLQGDPDDPVTRGFLCERTNRFLGRQYAADRLLRPQLRRDGRLTPVSWDAALDLAAERLLKIRAESGPAAILHYRSGGSLGILKAAASHLFEQFGPTSIKRGDICSGAGEAAQEADFGVCESSDLDDLLHSRLIVLWGKNVHVSAPHALPVLLEAKKRGAIVLGLDPVRTRAEQLCDLFLQPRPGADFAVAMALTRWLDDHGGVDPDAAEWCQGLDGFLALARARTFSAWARLADLGVSELGRFAALYQSRKPSSILVGWGLARRRNGSRTVRAIDGLAAVSGNVGIPGACVSYYFRRRSAFDLGFLGGEARAPRTFSETRLGAEVLAATDPPVRAIWVTAGNPAAMLPDSGAVRQAFAGSELNVVVDTHPSDTTDLAHLVLPTLTLLEDDDLMGAFGNHYLRASRPALPAPDGAEGPRHELHILQALASRLGLAAELAGSIDDWKLRLTGRLQEAGVTLDALHAGPVKDPFAAPVLFAGRRFPTPSGKAELLTDAPLPAVELTAEFPLTLLAVSTAKAQSSQWSQPLPPGPATATVHPRAANGFADGDVVRLESRVGAIAVRLKLSAAVRPDVVHLDKGGQIRDGRGANLLVEAVETDHGGGAAFYDEPVRLARVGG